MTRPTASPRKPETVDDIMAGPHIKTLSLVSQRPLYIAALYAVTLPGDQFRGWNAKVRTQRLIRAERFGR